MDQLKTQLAVVKQHSFWVMCLGILGMTIASWWISTGKLRAERDSRKGEIDSSITSISQIQTQQPQHPNAATNQGMKALKYAYALEVQKGWDLQYQRQEKILVWPPNFTQEFHDSVNKLRPIEKVPVTGAGMVPIASDLPQRLKEEYRDFIKEELPTLAKIIGTDWRVTAAAGTDGTGGMGGAMPGGFGGAMPGGFGGAMPGGFSGDGGAGLSGQTTDAFGNPISSLDPSIVRWNPTNQQES
jgi:hypothetical protein